MSLWYQSLCECLYDCEEYDADAKAKCILAHLSMQVPRLWWETALGAGDIPDTLLELLKELYEELHKLTDLANRFDYGLLIALAYSGDDENDPSPRSGTVYSEYSVEEYLMRAKRTLAERPELSQLGRIIESTVGSFT